MPHARSTAPSRCSTPIERKPLGRDPGQALVVGFQGHPKGRQQAAANVSIDGRDRSRRCVGALVQTAHRVNELER